MKLSVNTPEGTRDRLFAECMGRRQVQERLIRLFRQRGYREVSTPETEFYDLFARSGSAIPQEQMVQVFDQSGKLCVMRPDSTTPIARVAATKLRALPLPQRLYYDQTVYRAGPAHSGGNRELPQCGVELIGAAGMKADLEMVATAVDALRVCGASRFHVELGHAGFFRDVAARMELEEGEMEPFVMEVEGFAQGKRIGLFGSYGWGDGQWMRDWEERMKAAGAVLVGREGVIANEAPDEDALEQCRALGRELASI